MFPNYCFKNGGNDFSYDVTYVPKNGHGGSSHQCNHSDCNSHSRARSRQRHRSKLCYENILSMQTLLETNETLQQLHQTNSNKRKAQPSKSGRNVEFRLPPVEHYRNEPSRTPLRVSGGMDTANRQFHRKQRLQRESPEQSDLEASGSDSKRGVRDSCADFFNIIYENVLQAVHAAVDILVKKNFQDIHEKMEHLTEELSIQETLLKQINSNLISKISEQNQTSISQFKFIAQMLIDSQKIHYKTLNQQRFLRQKTNDEQENQEHHVDNPDRMQRAQENYTTIHSSKQQKQQHEEHQEEQQEEQQENQQQQPQQRQHQLWQQQDFSFLSPTPVLKIFNQKKSQSRSERCPSTLRRSGKGISTVSMPDLYRATIASTFNKNNTNRSKNHQRTPALSTLPSFDTARAANHGHPRKCRCSCASAASPTQSNNYEPSNASLARRSYRNSCKTMPSLEDVRAHR